MYSLILFYIFNTINKFLVTKTYQMKKAFPYKIPLSGTILMSQMNKKSFMNIHNINKIKNLIQVGCL